MSKEQHALIRRAYIALAYTTTTTEYKDKLLNDLEDYINSTGEKQ